MKRLLFSLFAITVAHAASPPPVVISSLPFTIPAPGTYVLAANLFIGSGFGISINYNVGGVSGPVIIDLQGFSISGPVQYEAGGINGALGIVAAGPISLTIQNGKINAFTTGINVSGSKLTVHNVSFDLNVTAVQLDQVSGASITDCQFSADPSLLEYGIASYGIYDALDAGGNVFDNLTFVRTYIPLITDQTQPYKIPPPIFDPLSLKSCQIYPTGTK